MAKQGRGSEQAMIRLPEGMRDKLKAAADEAGRSMNAEIVSRLEMSEDVERFLKDFELAKERILAAQRIEAALKQQVDILKEALDLERATNDRLLNILSKRLGMNEENMADVTADKD